MEDALFIENSTRKDEVFFKKYGDKSEQFTASVM